ncbi:hypothetical protein [Chryseobacterium sp.]|jgi:hypothetical protein|uniref:hypothetical protein n=1 Tax=Chryseobacterium sp. TaxID=1871047 RepID=UPI00284048BF|nr:hypothetical protein [Chryseobacterium sp.]MDR3026028.1 hypothetical protein [Chryseobacterium sp.]
MKKTIFIGALALITLAACQNEREDSTPNVEEKSEMAINAIKLDSKGLLGGESSKPAQMEAFIDCHTNFAGSTGNSCVWVDGMLFNVSWYTNQVATTSGANYSEKVYSASQVSFCSCGG